MTSFQDDRGGKGGRPVGFGGGEGEMDGEEGRSAAAPRVFCSRLELRDCLKGDITFTYHK